MTSKSNAQNTLADLTIKIYESEMRRLNSVLSNKTQTTKASCVVTTLANSAGGSGKSSTCQALATAIALDKSLHARVLIIELDPSGLADNISCAHNSEDDISTFDLWLSYALKNGLYQQDILNRYRISNTYKKYRDAQLTHTEIIERSIKKTHVATLDVITADCTASRAALWANAAHTDNFAHLNSFLNQLIERLTSKYDFIFIDTQSNLNAITLAAISSSSVLLTPMTANQTSLIAAQNFFNDLYSLVDELPDLAEKIEVIKSIIVNYDDTCELESSMAMHIQQILSDHCMRSLIHRSLAFEVAARNFCTIFDVSAEQISNYEVDKVMSVKALAREFIMMLETLECSE